METRISSFMLASGLLTAAHILVTPAQAQESIAPAMSFPIQEAADAANLECEPADRSEGCARLAVLIVAGIYDQVARPLNEVLSDIIKEKEEDPSFDQEKQARLNQLFTAAKAINDECLPIFKQFRPEAEFSSFTATLSPSLECLGTIQANFFDEPIEVKTSVNDQTLLIAQDYVYAAAEKSYAQQANVMDFDARVYKSATEPDTYPFDNNLKEELVQQVTEGCKDLKSIEGQKSCVTSVGRNALTAHNALTSFIETHQTFRNPFSTELAKEDLRECKTALGKSYGFKNEGTKGSGDLGEQLTAVANCGLAFERVGLLLGINVQEVAEIVANPAFAMPGLEQQ